MRSIIIILVMALLSSACDRALVIPFRNANSETINTECGTITLKLTRLGVFQLSILLEVESPAKVRVNILRILVDSKETEYKTLYGKQSDDELLEIAKSGRIVYEFTVPYDGEHKTAEMQFIADSFIITETENCGFGPITVEHTW